MEIQDTAATKSMSTLGGQLSNRFRGVEILKQQAQQDLENIRLSSPNSAEEAKISRLSSPQNQEILKILSNNATADQTMTSDYQQYQSMSSPLSSGNLANTSQTAIRAEGDRQRQNEKETGMQKTLKRALKSKILTMYREKLA